MVEGPLHDKRNRALGDLRISVTDRCNFRCTYCMPKEVFGPHHVYLPQREILTYEEIERVARVAVALGVGKIRLTGGEPLLRREIGRLVRRLARVEGVHDFALTTNGSALAAHAQPLKDAGLHRVTVSLDAISEGIFQASNDVRFPVARVLAGIDAARRAGLTPVKVNMVVQRGKNDGEIVPMAQHFRDMPDVIVRYIEFMDVGTTNGWRAEEVVSASEILDRLNEGGFNLQSLDATRPGEVARRWRDQKSGAELGIVASVSQPFCGACNRMRLSADGHLYTCLFASTGFDVRPLLREAASSDRALQDAVRSIWGRRTDRYSELRTHGDEPGERVEMSYIGG